MVELTKKIALIISDEENLLLTRLSIYITSLGRYPIAKNWETTKIREWPDGSIGGPYGWRVPTDYELTDNIIKKLKKEIRKKSSNPPELKRLC